MVRIKTQDIKLYQKLYYLNNREKILNYAKEKRESKNVNINIIKSKEKFKIIDKNIIIKFD